MKKSAAKISIAVLGLTIALSTPSELGAQWIARKAEEAAQRRLEERQKRTLQLNTKSDRDEGRAKPPRPTRNSEAPAERFAPNPAQGVLLAQVTPAGDQPAPGQAQPAPGQARPAPGQAQPAPGQAQPAPGQAQPAPGQAQPAPGQAQPAPGQAQPAPGQVVPADDSTRIDPNPANVGQLPSFAPGEYPIESILISLADVTQRTLLLDNSQAGRTPILDGTIKIISPIRNAGEEMLKALLEASNIRIHRRELKDGTEVIEVEPMQTTGAQQKDPTPRRVLHATEAGPHGEPIDFSQIPPDEFATMIFTLQYVTPRDAINALQSLISGTGGGAAGARGATAARLSSSFSMVEIENTQMLIVTAKFGLLDYLKTLLGLIDVPIKEPERIIEIKQIEWADASEIEGIVSEFIQGRGRGRVGRVGQRQITSPASARGQQSGAPTANLRGQQQDYTTKIIPDVRTNKLIIETYNEQDLQDIEMLVEELDVRFDLRRQRTHIYQVRYLKAEEVAQDLERLIQGQSSTGAGGLSRRSTRPGLSRPGTTVPRVGARTGTGQQQGGAPQNVEIPTMIVPHVPTNSLLIQGEKEEFDEILNILSRIDTKRRQVFLEAALVQVQSNSSLNYAIETIAGDPDDRSTRGLFASNFGLTGIDFDTWDRTILGSETGLAPTGGIFALMHRGDFPILVNFLKQHGDSQILATPFILADDNEQNRIDILETRYVNNTAVQNNQTTLQSQQGEPAGITLSIEPTISGSEKAVFLTMDLSVSEFQEATSADTLPPKNENTMTSAVTIPDGKIIVVGGLTRENKSKAVQKVPILGDIPLLGKLFRSENTVRSKNNLYIFLQAHVLTDEEFQDTDDLSKQAKDALEVFTDDVEPMRFRAPQYPGKGSKRSSDPDADRFFQINEPQDGVYDPYEGENSARRGRESGARESYNGGAGARGDGTGADSAVPASTTRRGRGWVGSSPTTPPTAPRPEESAESTGWFD